MNKSVVFGAVGDIAIVGDIAAHTQTKGPAWPMEEMLPILGKADILFGNMESVILPDDYPEEEISSRGLMTKFDGTPALKEAGFNFMNLANNHILDGGTMGMFHTRKRVESHGIMTGGVGHTQEEARQMKVIEKGGLRFGFLCYAVDSTYTLGTKGPSCAYYDPETIIEDIRGNRSKVDVLVVSLHADLEFMETPSVERKSIAHRLAESGATLILEHHPHVPQGVEMVGKSLIAYSLGDFCFPAYTDAYMCRHLPNTARAFVLLAEVSKDGVESFSRVPCKIMPPPQQRPTPLTGEEKDQMLAYLEKLDTMVRDDDIVRRNWHAITTKRLESAYHAIQAAPSMEAAKYLLGRWIFVEENLGWVRQAYKMMKEDWEKQGERVDLYHRPSCAFSAFERPKRGILKRAIVAARRLVSRLKRWYFVRKQ